jgi:AcrR family transcriptional regulator
MNEQKTETEQQILNAAKQVFTRKGFGGTRMQEIANEAKINKSLLHYYFRSKQLLFEAIFKDTLFEFVGKIKLIFNSEEELITKIPKIVHTYSDYLQKNPYIVIFILRELQAEPKIILKIVELINIKSFHFFEQINQEVQKGKMKPIKPEHLFINILSLTIFPVIAKPIIMAGLIQGSNELYNQFLEERKEIVINFIFSAIY